ncbi:MAG: hypothetical protein JWQ17_975 [Tardiphaga sp.]|nr:hypothetical protein [Tardiphaga sp.]
MQTRMSLRSSGLRILHAGSPIRSGSPDRAPRRGGGPTSAPLHRAHAGARGVARMSDSDIRGDISSRAAFPDVATLIRATHSACGEPDPIEFARSCPATGRGVRERPLHRAHAGARGVARMSGAISGETSQHARPSRMSLSLIRATHSAAKLTPLTDSSASPAGSLPAAICCRGRVRCWNATSCT